MKNHPKVRYKKVEPMVLPHTLTTEVVTDKKFKTFLQGLKRPLFAIKNPLQDRCVRKWTIFICIL
jgi:hypothetical protein